MIGDVHRLHEGGKQWIAISDTPQKMLGLSGGEQEELQLEQLRWIQHFTLLRHLLQERPRIDELPQGGGSFVEQESFGFGSLTLFESDARQVSERHHAGQERATELRAHTVAEQLSHGIKL